MFCGDDKYLYLSVYGLMTKVRLGLVYSHLVTLYYYLSSFFDHLFILAEGAIINNQAVTIHLDSCQRTSFLYSPSLILLSSSNPTNPYPIRQRRK